MAPTIRLGTASPGTRATTAETLTQLERIARRAASKKVDILLLPEAYLGGYPRGTHFGCVMGSRSEEGRNEYLRYFQSAVDLGDTVGDGAGAGAAWVNRELEGDPTCKAAVTAREGGKDGPNRRGDGTREELERIARETGVFLVTGVIEKAGGSLYCAVVYVCPSRGIVGKRRKVMPTGTERLVWAQGSPSTLRAVTTIIRGIRVNLGAAICWENYMPLVRQTLYSQNINLYLAPTADNRDTWLALLRTIAVEGRCFVISSNMCVPCPESAISSSGAATANGHQDQQTSNPDNDEEDATEDPTPLQTTAPTTRRSSCLTTPDGFEIALPATTPGGQTQISSPSRHRRRQSIFDDDGNEIVLCGGPRKEHSIPPRKSSPRSTTAHRAISPTTAAATKPSKFISRGGSSIVSPFGDVLAGPQWEDDEGLVYADVDFDDCIRGRLDFDAGGSYSRNDSFKFSVEGLNLTPLPY